MSKAFTLLETTISAALLAALAASTMSGMRAIAASATRASDHFDVGALSLAVDTVLDEPEVHGLPSLEAPGAWDGLAIAWPGATARTITIRSVACQWAPEGRRGPSAWLIFESDGAAVARWRLLQTPAAEPSMEAAR